jgi:murein DD-endopeptidase MepM/ murein hydrolase activator NlpD
MREPVIDPRVTSTYGWRVLNGKENFHDGVDFVTDKDTGQTAGVDRSVFSVGPGVVIYDKDNYNEARRWTSAEDSAGNMVIVQTTIAGVDYFVRYLHLLKNEVAVGQRVEAGTKLGEYADVGYSFGAHLHVDIYDKAWTKIDPRPILRLAGVSV